ncbi:MAG TPA: PAS domain-containing protein, partial [Gaiellaceae bacterium]|nr:PAS domain-containing protein [Gaiellaceae bacterium]
MKRTQERSGGGASELRRREPAEGEAGERILDHLLEGCQIIGFDWRYLYLNDVAAKHGRRRQDELVGRTMMECFPGIEQAPFFANLRDCMEHRRPHQVESEFTYPDGSRAWFELRIEPVPQGSFVLSLDISQRKRDDSRIGHLNAVLRGIRDVNQLIVRERDPEVLMARTSELLVEARGFRAVTIVLGEPGALRHRSAGEGTARLAALAELLDRGELPGCLADALELRTPQVRQPPSGDCASCPANLDFGLGRDIVALPIAYEGRSFGGLLVAIPEGMASEAEEMDLLREVAGDLAFALANGELRAERSRLEAQYLQAQKMEAIGRMAGGIAHDFNNLLAVVLGSADLALEDLAAESPSRADIEEIRRAAESGAQLTRQLLAFSRQQVLQPRVIDLRDIVAGMENLLRRIIGKDVRLETAAHAGPALVSADPGQI